MATAVKGLFLQFDSTSDDVVRPLGLFPLPFLSVDSIMKGLLVLLLRQCKYYQVNTEC